MPLTGAQLTTLKADIDSNSGAGGDFENTATTPDGDTEIRDAYSLEASPVVVAWKVSVSSDEANDAIDWSEYVVVPAPSPDTNDLAGIRAAMRQNTDLFRKDAALGQLLREQGFNPSLQKTRDALSEIFGNMANTKAALLALAKENANRGEALFVGAVVQGAVVRAVVGLFSTDDIQTARALP